MTAFHLAAAEPLQQSFISFDPSTLDFTEQYKLLGGTVIPRPIALVTTSGPHGVNAAPFSYFNAVGQLPPMLVFSIGPKVHRECDTLRNLQATGECVIHIVDDRVKEKMNICAVEYPEEVSEIERAGLLTAPSLRIKPPRLLECPVQFECRTMDIRKIGMVPYHLVLCEVVQFHYRTDVVNERLHIDPARLDPIGRLAGTGTYVRCTDTFNLQIPDVANAP